MLYAGGHSCDYCLLIPGAVYSKLNLHTCLASSAPFGPGLPLWFSSLRGSSWFPYSIVVGSKKVGEELPGLWGPMSGHPMHAALKLVN